MYVYQEKPERFAQYARKVWNVKENDTEKAALEGIRQTVDYFRSLDMPTSFGEAEGVGVQSDETLHAMAHSCTYGGSRTIGSFHVCDEEDIYKIYKMANKI